MFFGKLAKKLGGWVGASAVEEIDAEQQFRLDVIGVRLSPSRPFCEV
jgi:hypothetical protein